MKRLFLFCSGLKIHFRYKLRIILVCSAVALLSAAFGQNFTGDYDTIFLGKPNAKKMIYRLQDTILNEIYLHPKYPDRRPLSSKQARNNFLLGAATFLFPGALTSESEMDVIWELSADLVCNNVNFNWAVNLFCLGRMEKVREKVENDDGSFSTETTRTAYCYWENGAMGIIIEKGDTICWFNIIMDPKESPLLKPWSDEIYSEPVFLAQTSSKNHQYWHLLNSPGVDYAITGQFRNHNFVLINNGRVRKSWFYIEQDLACVFRPDVDFNRIKEQDRLTPYLLLSNSIPGSEHPDWFRLAIMTCFLNIKIPQASFGY